VAGRSFICIGRGSEEHDEAEDEEDAEDVDAVGNN
jgi:hypothetical protein